MRTSEKYRNKNKHNSNNSDNPLNFCRIYGGKNQIGVFGLNFFGGKCQFKARYVRITERNCHNSYFNVS